MNEIGRAPTSGSSVPPPSTGFARAWRRLLPAGIVVMAAATGLGVLDTTATSAWIFVAGVAIGLVGLASLAGHLFDLGRREVRELERRLEDELEERGRRRS
ncbi:MAG: hypothetical protein OEL76_12155 [Siculibacillus sp.]|nr:hypothetical protein [Siculibacillus sp.]